MALRQGLDVPQCNIVTWMPLATIVLLICKQTTDNFRTRLPPELPMAPSIGWPVLILFLINPWCSYSYDLKHWVNTYSVTVHFVSFERILNSVKPWIYKSPLKIDITEFSSSIFMKKDLIGWISCTIFSKISEQWQPHERNVIKYAIYWLKVVLPQF